jgi:hypothetical protein
MIIIQLMGFNKTNDSQYQNTDRKNFRNLGIYFVLRGLREIFVQVLNLLRS